jgi:hypothetical protein
LPPGVAAFSIAVLVATVPLSWVYRVLESLPEPIVLTHRRWPLWLNLLVSLAVTGTTAFFVRRLYYTEPAIPDPVADGLRLLITGLAYILGFVLLIRQHVGLYPEYFVAAGRGGFTVRKRLYENVVRLEEVREVGDETEVLLFMKNRERLRLSLPSSEIPRLYGLIEESQPDP